jgi:hypothetical protein
MRKLLFLLCVVALLVVPTMAYRYEATAPEGQAIYVIQIYSDGGTDGTIYMYQSNGDVTWGGWSYSEYTSELIPSRLATVSIGTYANTASTTYTNLAELVTNGELIVNFQPAYSNGSKIRASMGQTKLISDEEVSVSVKSYPIIKFLIVADKDVRPTVRYFSWADAMRDIKPASNDDIFALIKGYWDVAWGIFSTLGYWLKFLFWDHLTLTVVLYLTGSMAYYMNTSKDIFVFYTRWFRGLTGMFHFIANIYSVVISIITQIAQALKLI